MSYRCFLLTGAFAAIGVVGLLMPVCACGQVLSPVAKTAATGKAWTPPRTPDGHPDRQGVWTNNTVTPLERPRGLGAKEFYTEAELVENQKKESQRLALNEEEGLPTKAGTEADVHYEFCWLALARALAKLDWGRRTTMI